MTLRRGQRPPVDEQALGVVAGLSLAFVDTVALCRRLIEQRFTGTRVAEVRGDALAGARHVAYASRGTLSAMTAQELRDRLAPELDPFPCAGRAGAYRLHAGRDR